MSSNPTFTLYQNAIILFDGVCNLCNASVDFIIKRDKRAFFRFVSLQSDAGQRLLAEYKILPSTLPQKEQNYNSVIVIHKDKIYKKSSAVLFIARKISGFWFLLNLFWIVPPFLRDIGYDLVAKNRYRFFGKKNTCRVATPAEKERFLAS